MIHRGTCSVTASVWKIERKKVTFSGAAHCQHERGGGALSNWVLYIQGVYYTGCVSYMSWISVDYKICVSKIFGQ